MKRLFAMLICLVMLGSLTLGFASEAEGLQILGVRAKGTSLDVFLYAKAGNVISEKDFTLTVDKTEIPVNAISSYGSTSEGTSWVLVVEPFSNLNARKMILALVDDMVSRLGNNDSMAVYNTLTGERTEYLSSSASVKPIVEKALTTAGKNKLYDTIQSAVSELKTNQNLKGHKCLLVISQGNDQGSSITFDEVCSNAAELPITVYSVCVSKVAATVTSFGKLGRATDSGLAIQADKVAEATGKTVAAQIRENEKNFYALSASLASIPAETQTSDVSVSVTFQKDGQQLSARADHVNIPKQPSDCQHEWKEATCTEPKTCSICGSTEGEPLGHDFTEATCTDPKTCSRCGTTEGEALGHDFSGVSFFQAGKCTRCDEAMPSGFETLLHDNPLLVGMCALLVLLLIVVVIVLIRKGKNGKKEDPNTSGKSVTSPVDPKSESISHTKPLEPKLTVELTEKATGRKYIGKIYDTTIKAGLRADMKLEGDSSISKQQMEFIWQHGILYVQDLNSTNGTRVNGEKITKAVALHHNDIIRVGETDFIVNWNTN